MVTLPFVLVMCLASEVHAILRFSANVEHAHDRRDSTSNRLTQNPLQGIADDLQKTKEKAADQLQKGPGNDRKPMDPIESMRAMMCWGREKLLEHEDCMKWMTKHCVKETTGEGYCKKLRRYVKAKCKKGREKGCFYAKKLGIDMATDKEQFQADDEDGDGVPDKDDAFPDNPIEWKDSDGDGVGDNSDKWPNDPTCSDEGDICGGAPAPAPAMSPAPAPNGLTMDENVPLPSQGYNEHSADYVAHDDGKTMTRDWRAEWPTTGGSEEASIEKICEKNPNHVWCKLKQSKAARKAYAARHP